MSESASKLFKSLIEDVINVFPEYEKRLLKYYSSTLESDDNNDPKLKEFLENIEEITELAGCDLLTISPKLLQELNETYLDLPIKLNSKNPLVVLIKQKENIYLISENLLT